MQPGRNPTSTASIQPTIESQADPSGLAGLACLLLNHDSSERYRQSRAWIRLWRAFTAVRFSCMLSGTPWPELVRRPPETRQPSGLKGAGSGSSR